MNNKYDVSEIITKRFGKMFDYSTYLTHIHPIKINNRQLFKATTQPRFIQKLIY